MIYTYAIAPYDDWHRQAWAAGLVLLALVLVANLGCRLVLNRGGVFGAYEMASATQGKNPAAQRFATEVR